MGSVGLSLVSRVLLSPSCTWRKKDAFLAPRAAKITSGESIITGSNEEATISLLSILNTNLVKSDSLRSATRVNPYALTVSGKLSAVIKSSLSKNS